MIKFKITLLLLLFNLFAGKAQNYSFDTGSTNPFQITTGTGSITLASAPYKDGTKSMCWAWSSSATTLQLNYTINANDWRDGVLFWIYNETPTLKPLRTEFRSSSGAVQYYFDFGLNFSGWRICRIGTAYMKGSKLIKTGLKLHMISPTGVTNGKLYIDRFSFLADVDADNAPDAQQPENNIVSALSHWGLIWEWENTLNYTTELKTSLTSAEQTSLASIISGISGTVPKSANATVISTANTLFTSSAISMQNGFLTGAPFVTQWDKKTGDISFTDIGSMLLGFAEDFLYNGIATSKDKFMLVWDYAQSQGFSYGSSMGVNHHYGYNTRDIFTALFLMRNELKSTGRLTATAAALSYWSGLPETRAGYDFNRNGVVDCWNTLLMPRLIAAAMIENETERYRAIESLNNWLGESLLPTPGNTGGIKPDGTVFHHGGAYPAYATGGLGGLGNYCESIYKSTFNLPKSSRISMANALLAISNYTNKKDWSIGFSGRHPFSGSISQSVIDAMAYLSMMGGIYDENVKFDKRLASAYLRHQTTSSSIRTLVINTTGATTAPDPQGFYVFNHAAMGIHRTGNAMVSIKGYNSDVWGSEIYTNDNLYGRYQSYGAVEIMNGGNPVTQASSRFLQPGWDWNRLPGTTTIHLPNNLLKSPLTTTVMSRSDEDFAGASSLDTLYGIFGMKLHEKSDIINTNYTPGFRARKSVFAFGKRLICLGSNISNTNSTYNTETTLYQNALNSTTETISINDVTTVAFGINQTFSKSTNNTLLSDVLGNYYSISPQTEIKIKGSLQNSNDQETAAATTGNFVTAWINHGPAPSLEKYEYMIMLKPTTDELNLWKLSPGYTVIQCDNNAHIVKDIENNITGYVSFLDVSPKSGLITDISAESLVMLREIDSSHLSMSVCDPSIHLPVKVMGSTNTSSPSQIVVKDMVLTGRWLMESDNNNVALSYINNSTVLSVSCLLGIPVDFKLKQYDTIVTVSGYKDLSNLNVGPETEITVTSEGNLTISNASTFKNLTINAGGRTTNNSTLNVKTFTINCDSTLPGTFLDNGTTTSTTSTVNQTLFSGRNWYISSPVSGATTTAINAITGSSILSYDEQHGTSSPWITETTTLAVGKGYVLLSPIHVNPTIHFNGTINTGEKIFTLTRTAGQTKEGFNLIGNPYPSYVNWLQATKVNVGNTIWYRTKNNASAYVFDTFNASTNAGTNNNMSGAVTGYIPPLQAVWVRVNEGQSFGNITFKNSMRLHATGSSTSIKVKSETTQKLLRMRISNKKNSDETLVVIHPEASNNYDQFDSEKMSNNNADIPEINTYAGAEKLVINGMNNLPLNMEMKLGFKTEQSGTFYLQVTELINMDDFEIYVRDNSLNTTFELTKNEVYTFSSDVFDNDNRFDIIFKSTTRNPDNNFSELSEIKTVYREGKLSIIANMQFSATDYISVYNSLGQLIILKSLQSPVHSITEDLVPGTYLVTLQINGEKRTDKIIIQ